jgi:hypothetical protein
VGNVLIITGITGAQIKATKYKGERVGSNGIKIGIKN